MARPLCAQCIKTAPMAALHPALSENGFDQIKERLKASNVERSIKNSTQAVEEFQRFFEFFNEPQTCMVCFENYPSTLATSCESGCTPSVCSECMLQGLVSTGRRPKCVICREDNMPIAEVEVSLRVLVTQHSVCECTNAECLCKSRMVESYKSEVAAYHACACGNDRRSERLAAKRKAGL